MPVKSDIISMGAEATLRKKKVFGKWIVEKTRVPKGYRHAQLDQQLRKERTAHEARMLHEAKTLGIVAPDLYSVDLKNAQLLIEFVDAPRLKHVLLQKTPLPRKNALCESFGKLIALLHVHGLVHGDLTTSNVLVRKKGKKDELVLIDFGLSFHSKKMEDLAVDLVNLKKTFTATHADMKEGWSAIQKAYISGGGKKETLRKMEEVESRIRYA